MHDDYLPSESSVTVAGARLQTDGECPNPELLRVSTDMRQLTIDGTQPEVSRRGINIGPTLIATSTLGVEETPNSRHTRSLT